MVEAYPLSWPQGWPRTQRHKVSLFRVGDVAAKKKLLAELHALGAKDVVISTNVETYWRGNTQVPYANRTVEDPGVAVCITLEMEGRVLACDTWNRVKDNLHAIGLTVQAMRGMKRRGTSQILTQAFTGLKALPERGTGEPWWTTLGVQPGATQEEITRAYRTLAMKAHPDRGGSVEAFQQLHPRLQPGPGRRARAGVNPYPIPASDAARSSTS